MCRYFATSDERNFGPSIERKAEDQNPQWCGLTEAVLQAIRTDVFNVAAPIP